ncbi:MAG: CHASE2 domain-containing protein, partial [Okeania sp. SIO2H7]|nr:CHASE2 domain-containing protein [Okeania sp. SIO2H7]
AYSLPDLFNTPYSTGHLARGHGTPGVEVHANLASQIISAALDGRPLIQSWSERTEWLWIFGWSVAGTILAWFWPSPPWTACRVTIAIVVIHATGYIALIKGWWLPVIPAALGLTGSAVAVTGYLVHKERQGRQTVMDIFGRHVTPKIAQTICQMRDDILEEGELLGQEMTATVLFTDLKGFTTLAEGMEPKTLMSFLNEYMQAMAKVVLDNDGIIDKFIGDAVMAAFGVPIPAADEKAIATDAEAAVKCAIEMAVKLKSLNEDWAKQGKPTLSMRVGIATGQLVAGCLGGAMRQDYTIIGDTVNVAARLESYDKSLDGGICRILISEETWRYVEGKFAAEAIGSVVLKGRLQAIQIYLVSINDNG